MKRFTMIVAILLVAVLACGMLFACGDNGGTQTGTNTNTGSDTNQGTGDNSGSSTGSDTTGGTKYTLTIWGSEQDQAMLKEMCAAYATANPQNTYKFLFGVQSESDAADKVLNDVESGPDVFSFASDQINKLYAGGALARIGGNIESNVKEVNSAGSIDAATLTVGGEERLYAYPVTGDNDYFVYYDKRVFTEESQLATLDNMLATAAAAGKTVHFKLNDDGWYLSSFFFAVPELEYQVTYDDKMKETAVAINYDDPKGLMVMQSLNTYLQSNALVAQTDDGKITAGFTDGSVAAAVSGTWNRKTLEDLLGENLGVCKLPTANIGGQQVQLSGYMGYKLMGVNGFSKNKGEAHKLAQWLTNQENQIKRFETRAFAPTNKVAAALEQVTGDPVISVVMQQAQFNRSQKGVPSTYWTPMGSLITPIITAKAEGKVLSDAELQALLDALCTQIRK